MRTTADRIDPGDATFQALIANAREPMFVWTLAGETQWISYANAAMVAFLGLTAMDELLGRDAREAFLATGGVRRNDGVLVQADLVSRPVELAGVPSYLVVVRPLANQPIKFAHDYNNLLGVILSNVDFALEDLDPTNPTVSELHEIEAAARRAIKLTNQLLAIETISLPRRCRARTASALYRARVEPELIAQMEQLRIAR